MMFVELISQRVGRLAECICDDGVRRVNNLIKLSTSIKTLRDKKIKELVAKESDILAKLKREEEQRKQPLEEVNLWLDQVKEAKTKVDAAITTYEHKGDDSNCFARLRQLLELAENVEEEVSKEVEVLLAKQFQDGLVIEMLPPKATMFNSLSLLRSRSTTTEKRVEEIMRLVKDPNVGKIGVCGMGGVGKTTIMKTVNDGLAEYFDRIIWVTVTKEMGGIETLQSKIAEQFSEAFKMDLLSEVDKEKRASMLLNKLKNEKKLLIILDDLWDEISLNKVGIPDPQRSASEDCKIVVTTRDLTVCDSIKTQVNVQITSLSEEDAWDLFRALVQNDELLYRSEIEPLARDVVSECGGLPLAIVTIAPVMSRMENVKQWDYNLNKLRSSKAEIEGPDGDVFQLLRFSYDHLKEERIKKCFLYCTFYPEDHQIETKELIEYWMAEGFLEEEKDEFELNTSSRRDEIGRGFSILKELTDSCMLETIQAKGEEYVKMHDLLRDLAIRIMKEDYGYVSKAGMHLKQFPKLAWEKVSKLSLMNNRITVLPQLNCPNLSSLLLRRNGDSDSVLFFMENGMAIPSLTFPDSFFSQMPALQVLDLSHSSFVRKLPSSLAELTNLRALYLRSLTLLRKIPPLTKLTKLRMLDFGGTYIEEIVGLEYLVDLRYLNLHGTPELRHIQADALSKLTLLEELYLFRCEFFSEFIPNLTQLERLAVLQMSFWRYEDYLKAMVNINWNELKDFFINLRASPTGESFEAVAHKVKVVQIDGLEISKQLSSFCVPINTEALRIGHSVALPHLYKIPCIKRLKSLKKLYLDFEFLSDCLLIGDEMEPNMFASLEGLRLRYWYNLQVICKGMLPSGCFNNLKIIYVDSCGRLKNLFSFKVLQQLKSIEVIKVTSSENIEEISSPIDEDDQKDDTTLTEIVLPKLQSLHLWDLPRLQRISTRAWVCESLKIIAIFGCPGLQKFPFKSLLALENIYGTIEWWEAMEWDGPESKTLLQPYFVDRNANSRAVTQIGEF